MGPTAWCRSGPASFRSASSRGSTSRRAPASDEGVRRPRPADGLPHRREGEGVPLDHVPRDARRILDLGTGDGRLLALLRLARPDCVGVGLDVSEPMLKAAHERFADQRGIELVRHDLAEPLPDLGSSNMSPRRLRACTVLSIGRSATPPTSKILPTTCSTLRHSLAGCAISASPMSIAIGSGWRWRCYSASNRSQITPFHTCRVGEDERQEYSWGIASLGKASRGRLDGDPRRRSAEGRARRRERRDPPSARPSADQGLPHAGRVADSALGKNRRPS